MSATVMNNLPVTEPQTAKLTEDQNEIKSVNCECCGLTEECTASYIYNIRDRYKGKWICGLCSEAVKDEVVRGQMLITTEEALNKHMMFRNKFAVGPPTPAVDLVFFMRKILRRSVIGSSSSSSNSMPSSPRKTKGVLARSESCIPSLSLEEDDDVAVGDDVAEEKRSD